jgi:hypothetical protein
MSADTEAIRAALADPRDVAARLGLLEHAKKQPGGGLLVICPAHGDRGPSCSLTIGDDRTLRVRCFACDLAGDIFDLLAAVEGLDRRRDFRAVFVRAAELAGIDPRSTSRAEHTAAPPLPPRAAPPGPALDPATFDRVARAILSAGRLDASAAADVACYLSARGLLDAARADGWGALPPIGSVAVDRHELAAAGLALPSGSDWIRPAWRLCIPWRDRDGRIVTLQRRALGNADPRYVLPAGRAPASPYGIERLTGGGRIVIVEGAIDALAARLLARTRVVVLGLAGVEAWRQDWAEHMRGRRVSLATDADAAGEQCAGRIAGDLQGVAVEVRRVVPPAGAKDWADALRARAVAA